MKARLLVVALWISNVLFAQNIVSGKQCSKLREITYQALYRQFADVLDKEQRSSNGYSTNGQWKFTTTRYDTWMLWEGALSSSIEHYVDERDSIIIDSWQYLADFGTVTDTAKANTIFSAIRSQVEGCILPVADSLPLLLQPAEPDALPITMPENLAEAMVYSLPDENTPGREVLLMVALEKTKRGIRPMLIIEAYEERLRFSNAKQKPL